MYMYVYMYTYLCVYRNAHAVGAEVAQPQDPLAVRHHDHLPIRQNFTLSYITEYTSVYEDDRLKVGWTDPESYITKYTTYTKIKQTLNGR